MQDFEKLGVFYLGREYDLAARQTRDELLLYDAKDLTTHAVCVGMTGSGKTGLCLVLLEEAAIDGVPAIAIDPKGDLGNLLLNFPDLKPEDFQPWVDAEEAQRKGLSVEELARRTAEGYRQGLAAWGQDAARIGRLRDAVDMAIYTPGSSAGLPLGVLRSLAPPPQAVLDDADALGERIGGAVAGLLGLVGVEADPLQSPEHILLATLLGRAWRAGRSLDIAGLIQEIQSPPIDKIGVMDLESVFPAKARFALAMRLNNLVASPGFAAWQQGEPLDVGRLLYTAEGRPRLSILSIAHLSDAERMFFVTLLLNEVIAWMRSQPGTSSLRAILYMDEIFGYFPPLGNPPSKTPMLTLLKQARAFGLGVVLATQNPVDLDYKGLSNAGTWFLGRLQTERDKARVMDGLASAAATAGAGFDRQTTDAILSSLGGRVFLMNNVHEDRPVVFQSRWALSYLRGPLSRAQIQTLTQGRKPLAPAAESLPQAPPAAETPGGARPVLAPGVPQVFFAARGAARGVWYRPVLLGMARLHFAHARLGVDHWQEVALVSDAEDGDWESAEVLAEAPDLEDQPEPGASFAPVPSKLAAPKVYAALGKSLASHLYRTQSLACFRSTLVGATSRPGESEGEFRVRIRQQGAEQRDLALEKLRAKYAPKLAALEEQVRRAQQRLEREQTQAQHQTFHTAVSVGTSILGALLGRKLASSTNLTRAASSARAASRIARERADVAAAEDNLDVLRQRAADLEEEFRVEADKLRSALSVEDTALESVEIKPKKSDIVVERVALAWRPEASR